MITARWVAFLPGFRQFPPPLWTKTIQDVSRPFLSVKKNGGRVRIPGGKLACARKFATRARKLITWLCSQAGGGRSSARAGLNLGRAADHRALGRFPSRISTVPPRLCGQKLSKKEVDRFLSTNGREGVKTPGGKSACAQIGNQGRQPITWLSSQAGGRSPSARAGFEAGREADHLASMASRGRPSARTGLQPGREADHRPTVHPDLPPHAPAPRTPTHPVPEPAPAPPHPCPYCFHGNRQVVSAHISAPGREADHLALLAGRQRTQDHNQGRQPITWLCSQAGGGRPSARAGFEAGREADHMASIAGRGMPSVCADPSRGRAADHQVQLRTVAGGGRPLARAGSQPGRAADRLALLAGRREKSVSACRPVPRACN